MVKMILLLFSLVSFISCNESNKEIADVSKNGTTTAGGTEGGDTGGDTGGNTGGDTGGNTGSDTGGDTGSDTGGDTGSDTGGDTGTPSADDTDGDGVANDDDLCETSAGKEVDGLGCDKDSGKGVEGFKAERGYIFVKNETSLWAPGEAFFENGNNLELRSFSTNTQVETFTYIDTDRDLNFENKPLKGIKGYMKVDICDQIEGSGINQDQEDIECKCIVTEIDNKIEWLSVKEVEGDKGAIKLALTEEAMSTTWQQPNGRNGIVCFPGGGAAGDAPAADPEPEVDPPATIIDQILALAEENEAEVKVRCNGGAEHTLTIHANGHAE